MMKKRAHFFRLGLLAVVFLFLLSALVYRMIDLTVWNRPFLLGQGEARSLRTIDIPAYRGMIMDRNGVPLAVSTPVKTVWINPKEFNISKEKLQALQKLIPFNQKNFLEQINKNKSKEFMYLSRQVAPELAKKIAALDIEGIHFREEFKRYYPESESSAHVVGFTNIDDKGLEGVELVYQDWLMGVKGSKRVIKDRTGRVIDELGMVQEPRPGNDLTLSIDRRLQYIAFQELTETVKEFDALSGTVVVLDSQNGEILAMANVPVYNPNVRGHYDANSYRNRAATDTFEPGSVIKPFSIASALESGKFKADTIIDTNPSWMMVHGHTVRDGRNYGVLDITGVLKHSSNVGVTKMVLASPPEQLINVLEKAGFGMRTESSYPGESSGTMVHPFDANPFVLATLGFGYGMSVTPLQLAKAYMIFANEGQLKPVSLLHDNLQAESIPVIRAETAREVLKMMEAVVNDKGTGSKAKIEGYRVAGKTGTSRIAGKHGYEANRHIASFVGIAPVSNPRFIVAVVIHEPQKKSYYGASVAAPLFARVMKSALHLYDVKRDDV